MKYISEIIAGVVIIGLFVLGVFIYLGGLGKTSTNEVVYDVSNEEDGAINPISLRALMDKEYDGRDLKLGSILEENSAYTRYFITYKSGDLTISGIMNIPKGNIPEGGWPVLFLNHGHIDTSVYTNGRGLRREQDYLARQGFAVLHSDYRNHAQSDKDPNTDINIRVGYIEDVINAVMAVKNSNIDYLSKESFGMLGHSMGGGISQAVMVVKQELVKAFVLYAPVSSDVVDSYNRWTTTRPTERAKIDEIHGSPTSNPEFWKQMSPRTFLSRAQAPVMIFHGTADKDCELEWSQITRDVLEENGKSVELVEYLNEGHEFGPRHTDFMQRTTEFFRSNL